jgi:hypothetical protein
MKSRKICENLRKTTVISNSPLIDVSQEKYAKIWENLQ